MQMRPSRVLQKLRAGEVVNCFKLNLSCPRTADLVAAAAFDCIWVDLNNRHRLGYARKADICGQVQRC